MIEEETTEALAVSSRTVRSDWATAKKLLHMTLATTFLFRTQEPGAR